MRILHFSPAAALDPKSAGTSASIAHLPLANGHGDVELSCLYVAPGGQIAVPASRRDQLLLIVNGRGNAYGYLPPGLLQLSGGMGLLIPAGESCRLSSQTGAILLVLEVEHLTPDPCGLSHPNRLRGALWPQLESNGVDPVSD